MTCLEHYFENLLFHGEDTKDEPNKKALSKEVQEAVEICANYVIYTTCGDRNRFKKFIEIKLNNPQDDSWEEYVNTLYDLAYKHGAFEVVKELRDEISKYPAPDGHDGNTSIPCKAFNAGIKVALESIDKCIV